MFRSFSPFISAGLSAKKKWQSRPGDKGAPLRSLHDMFVSAMPVTASRKPQFVYVPNYFEHRTSVGRYVSESLVMLFHFNTAICSLQSSLVFLLSFSFQHRATARRHLACLFGERSDGVLC
jgi:hypothetical protein